MTKDTVFAILKNEGATVSGERISGRLGVSRAAVNAAIKALREDGYDIESATNRGYLLRGGPEKLNAGELLARLGEERMRRVVFLDTVDSTNTYLRALALSGAPEGQIAVAGRQTGGRGRLGRAFASPEGMGVYLSALLRPDCRPEEVSAVTGCTAVAMADAVQNACGVRPGVKWVNDLLLDGKKIAGILTELSVEGESGSVQYVIVGVGVNCNQLAGDFPGELAGMAGSVRMHTGEAVCRADLAAEMIAAFDVLAEAFPAGRADYLAAYRQDCVTPGNTVTVRRGEQEREAFAEGIGEDFGLRVRYAGGGRETLSGGEVSVRGLLGYV
ncbi:MAG TPA: biotin--[acetyl-CoA-carboxylase] ligase [Oscillospiraceae bacterium]|nr:biotin--[acetyl-CoA-carboxylase] ligase [Oscillospiraceae bacterium]